MHGLESPPYGAPPYYPSDIMVTMCLLNIIHKQ